MMHPFTELYSRLMSLCGLSLRLGGVTLVVGTFAALCHYSGLWDVAYRATPPLPCTQLLTLVHYNPLIAIEARMFGSASLSNSVARSCQPRLTPPPLPTPSTSSWRLLWEWLSAARPFAHNPFPVLRAARWHDTQQTLTFFVSYYCDNLIVCLVLVTAGCGVWLLVVGSVMIRKRIRPAHTSQLSDQVFRSTPVTVPIATA